MSANPPAGSPRDGERRVLTITREFRAPIEDVWASVTESERLARWIGTFTGDPASGRVAFLMTAEGATEPEEMEIRECDPPRVLRVTSHVGEEQWLLDLAARGARRRHHPDLRAAGHRPGGGRERRAGLGVLPRPSRRRRDRGEVGAIDFERDYYPAMVEHYREQAR